MQLAVFDLCVLDPLPVTVFIAVDHTDETVKTFHIQRNFVLLVLIVITAAFAAQMEQIANSQILAVDALILGGILQLLIQVGQLVGVDDVIVCIFHSLALVIVQFVLIAIGSDHQHTGAVIIHRIKEIQNRRTLAAGGTGNETVGSGQGRHAEACYHDDHQTNSQYFFHFVFILSRINIY